MLEESLKDFEKQPELLGRLSHELNTPLTNVLGHAHYLRRNINQMPADERLKGLEVVEANAERLAKHIQNLLLLARLERKEETVADPVLMSRLVERVAQSQCTLLPFRGLETHIAQVHQPVEGDSDQIKIAVCNVLDNATTFSPSDTPVRLELTETAQGVEVSVHDRGIGITAADADIIYLPFHRSPRVELTHPGLGIGLTVADLICQRHGGKITHQLRPGGGTTFQLFFPFMV
jgi:signal transduction histidine kinase